MSTAVVVRARDDALETHLEREEDVDIRHHGICFRCILCPQTYNLICLRYVLEDFHENPLQGHSGVGEECRSLEPADANAHR